MTVASVHASPLSERVARRFDRVVWSERLREFAGGHSVDAKHRPHLTAAVEWIARAQDSTGTGGIARGYAVAWNPYFGLRGWEPAYPETTGYIIPTLYSAAHALRDPSLATRATRAAVWELGIQLPSGAVRAGLIGRPPAPAIFNTGQVIFGWLSAHAETGESTFADAACAAARYLISTLDDDGMWRRDNSRFALSYSTLYNARVSWALAEVGRRLNMPAATDAAARSLSHVASMQRANGWIPSCCLTEPARPLLHTLAYAIRGLLEGGRVIDDATLIQRASKAAGAIAETVLKNGSLAGRFDHNWTPSATWSCLTGEAQMAGIWLRLFEITGDARWLEPALPVIRHLKSTQNRTSDDPGLRGGIKGSGPFNGGYAAYETLSWAAKFFVDLLLRHERITTTAKTAIGESELLS